ncbi:2'-5' RNA ligase family protein [Cohnella sp. 56]|uniref:2'-5' RNA ligase family protein n=1 Tax=Cohnella sp. 56 TaxID=3113722 RepID=UPI0030E7B063
MDNLRLFFGISLPDSIEVMLGARARTMRQKLAFRKWTHPSDYHITIHYLGNIAADSVPEVLSAAREAGQSAAPVRLSPGGPGIFGVQAAPRVLWCGVQEDSAAVATSGSIASPPSLSPLHALHRLLGDRLQERIGYRPEARPYHPHITLARSWEGGSCSLELVREAWGALPDAEPGPTAWTSASITLYRSHPGSTPSYERLEQIPLLGERSTAGPA